MHSSIGPVAVAAPAWLPQTLAPSSQDAEPSFPYHSQLHHHNRTHEGPYNHNRRDEDDNEVEPPSSRSLSAVSSSVSGASQSSQQQLRHEKDFVAASARRSPVNGMGEETSAPKVGPPPQRYENKYKPNGPAMRRDVAAAAVKAEPYSASTAVVGPQPWAEATDDHRIRFDVEGASRRTTPLQQKEVPPPMREDDRATFYMSSPITTSTTAATVRPRNQKLHAWADHVRREASLPQTEGNNDDNGAESMEAMFFGSRRRLAEQNLEPSRRSPMRSTATAQQRRAELLEEEEVGRGGPSPPPTTLMKECYWMVMRVADACATLGDAVDRLSERIALLETKQKQEQEGELIKKKQGQRSSEDVRGESEDTKRQSSPSNMRAKGSSHSNALSPVVASLSSSQAYQAQVDARIRALEQQLLLSEQRNELLQTTVQNLCHAVFQQQETSGRNNSNNSRSSPPTDGGMSLLRDGIAPGIPPTTGGASTTASLTGLAQQQRDVKQNRNIDQIWRDLQSKLAS